MSTCKILRVLSRMRASHSRTDMHSSNVNGGTRKKLWQLDTCILTRNRSKVVFLVLNPHWADLGIRGQFLCNQPIFPHIQVSR